MTRGVYLDYNATAPLRSEAAAAVRAALEITGNPSSVHAFGRRARSLLEDSRAAVAALVGAMPAGVAFTSGGTEANNLALRGCGRRRLLVSAGEHDSVLQAVPDATKIPLHANGLVDLAALESLLAESDVPALVSVMLANNETGVIQPVAQVAALAGQAGALVHCDAVQAAGKIPVDMTALGVDLLSLSAHKIGGPAGVGALLLRDGVPLESLIKGGGQERSRRAGTENLAGIAGFAAAAAAVDLSQSNAIEALRDRLEAGLKALAPEVQILGAEVPRLPNTCCAALPGLGSELQVMALDLAGVAVSAGSACSSGKVQPSHVLRAMGADAATAGSAIRVSLGWQSGLEDVEAFLSAWQSLYLRRQGDRPALRVSA